MRIRILGAAIAVAAVLGVTALASSGSAEPAANQAALIARGRYLSVVGGCSDCHTEGWFESDGQIAEKDWLEGSSLGWHGPWGTTYPVNLRLLVSRLTLPQWLTLVSTGKFRPPMPWWALHTMTRRDRIALYEFIRHLGPAGKEAPAYLPPGVNPPAPAVLFPMPPKKGGHG